MLPSPGGWLDTMSATKRLLASGAMGNLQEGSSKKCIDLCRMHFQEHLVKYRNWEPKDLLSLSIENPLQEELEIDF